MSNDALYEAIIDAYVAHLGLDDDNEYTLQIATEFKAAFERIFEHRRVWWVDPNTVCYADHASPEEAIAFLYRWITDPEFRESYLRDTRELEHLIDELAAANRADPRFNEPRRHH